MIFIFGSESTFSLMKKSSAITTSFLLLTFAITSISAVAAAPNTASSDWLYQPLSYGIQASQGGALPSSIPYCFTGSGYPILCYTPKDLRAAYNFPSTLDGSGQTILIVDAYGSPTIQSDLATFDSAFGIAAPPYFTILCPTGCPTYNPRDTFHNVAGWALETSLDVEYAHAMAPGAKIVLVVASSSSGNDINTAERMVIPQFPGSIMSQSFGTPEYLVHANSAQFSQAEKNYITAMNLGITVFASAGDSGATNGGSAANAGFPASDPFVTAVGGTMGNPYIPFGTGAVCPSGTCSTGLVTVSGSPTCGTDGHTSIGNPSLWCTPVGYGGEQVWNEPIFGAAGGGAPSSLFGVPGYQGGLELSSRTVPDVSYNAAVDGGVLVYSATLGGYYFVGGTSAGSPQWAAIAALANQAAGRPLGFLNPAIYEIGASSHYASDFHDITVGNNQLAGTPVGFPAGSGWDDATGWGTPNVGNLIPDLASPP
jgi:subtilase family serine protease